MKDPKKNIKSKRRRQDPRQEEKSGNTPVAPVQDDGGGEMDFGGLPKRDLKKNLGCG